MSRISEHHKEAARIGLQAARAALAAARSDDTEHLSLVDRNGRDQRIRADGYEDYYLGLGVLPATGTGGRLPYIDPD